MLIYNFKINGNKFFRFFIIFLILIALLILFASVYNLYYKNKFILTDSISNDSTAIINSNNYTNVLKQVYDDVDTYVGQSINFTGYVYKLFDFNNTEFVLARDMLINSDSQSVVVGFLCSSDNATNFENGTWVNVTGTFTKGYYHGEIPIIQIEKIEKTNKPDEEYVYPPDDTYIPTSVIM